MSQLALSIPSTWGGSRPGAGRKPVPGRRRSTPHRARPPHKAPHPVHVTLRARPGLPSLRTARVFGGLRDAIATASTYSFRVLHFSVQGDHVHLLVEAQNSETLSRGARGLVIRAARVINRRLGRVGKVWGDRYHARALTSPLAVRHALVYVLMNVRKHHPGETPGLDPRSSAQWFDGFRDIGADARGYMSAPVCRPRTWLAAVGWRRHGLIGLDEVPGSRRISRTASLSTRSPRRPRPPCR
jgi:REP element-mobilizing transposase RayT